MPWRLFNLQYYQKKKQWNWSSNLGLRGFRDGTYEQEVIDLPCAVPYAVNPYQKEGQDNIVKTAVHLNSRLDISLLIVGKVKGINLQILQESLSFLKRSLFSAGITT
jgi:hypothetical protein